MVPKDDEEILILWYVSSPFLFRRYVSESALFVKPVSAFIAKSGLSRIQAREFRPRLNWTKKHLAPQLQLFIAILTCRSST